MNTLSTVVAGTLLAIGLAGNAAAAPSNHAQGHGAKKVVIVKAPQKKAAKRVVVKRVAQKKVILKKVIKKQHAKTYRVRSGDTLSKIAARNHTSVQKLIKLNGLWGNKANNIKIGMNIRIS